MNIKTVPLAVALALHVFAADDAARIQELEKKLDNLDKKYRVLERKLELEQETSSEKAKATPTMSLGAGGFVLASADTNFVLRIRGLLQTDARFYLNDGGNNGNDRFLLRRARPIFEGSLWNKIDFAFVPEFGGGSATAGTGTIGTPSILDAFVNLRYSPELQLQIGKFKSPVGLEELQSDAQMPFIERGQPSSLIPNRDIGAMLHGEILDGVINYQAGVFNGVGDNQNSANVDFDDKKDVEGRLFAHPFQKLEFEPLQKLGIGGGGSFGNADGASGLPSGNGFATEAGETFFTYSGGTTAAGQHWRLSPQAYWYWKSFGLLGEYVVSSQEVRRIATGINASERLENKSWQILGTYVLTGEEAGYRGVIPKHSFSLTDGHWGAFDVVARYSVLTIDEKTFPVFASTAASARQANAFTFGFNWYLNRNVRASIDYTHTDFKGGVNSIVARQNENAIVSRFQLAF